MRGMKDIPVPERAEIQQTLETIAQSQYEGVPGVMVFEGKEKGETLGITLCTHGNEPCGLAALWYLLKEKTLLANLPKGRLIFTLNNLEASKRYWADPQAREALSHRYVDFNMNRLPKTVMEDVQDTRYEAVRVRALLPIWQQFDVGMDIHTTSQEAPPMLIAGREFNLDVVKHFPINRYISGLRSIMSTSFVTRHFKAEAEGRAFLIECGQHEAESAFKTAIMCVLALMKECGMIDIPLENAPEQGEHYRVTESVFFPDDSYEQVRIYPNFAAVKAGEVLATGNGDAITAPFDGHVIMAPSVKKPVYLDEEIYFFARPMEKIRLKKAS